MRKTRDIASNVANHTRKPSCVLCVLCVSALVLSSTALAGGSNYNITPGALPVVKGQVTEWDVPTPKFARDPAPAPDGTMYITVMQGDRIAHFDPATTKFREWDVPARPRTPG